MEVNFDTIEPITTSHCYQNKYVTYKAATVTIEQYKKVTYSALVYGVVSSLPKWSSLQDITIKIYIIYIASIFKIV